MQIIHATIEPNIYNMDGCSPTIYFDSQPTPTQIEEAFNKFNDLFASFNIGAAPLGVALGIPLDYWHAPIKLCEHRYQSIGDSTFT